MCKYCKMPVPEPIHDVFCNCPTDMYIEKDYFSKKNEFFFKVVSEVNMGIAGNHGILASVKIKYCPICGRKLEDTENV